jgi:ribosomal protein S27AE
MKTKPFPQNSALRYFLCIAVPIILWSALCFWLILSLDERFSPNTAAGIGIAIGIVWLAVGLLAVLIGKRLFLPDRKACPNCGDPLALRDDGEKTFYYYVCDRCRTRWQTNINRGIDD